jgi:ABC-type bacteriocin/lantibiotic exporter with double-glycine peptidase domain
MTFHKGLRARVTVSGALSFHSSFLKAAFLPALCAVLFVACAPVLPVTPRAEKQARLTRVPFFPQEDYQCGPSAIASVINYWYGKENMGRSLPYEQAVAHTYSPSARGVLGLDLKLYARKLGFHAEERTGSMEELRGAIDRGTPAIILVDYGISLYQRNHFMVVVGYTGDSVVVNSGRREGERIPNGDLNKIWQKTGFWTLIIQPSA